MFVSRAKGAPDLSDRESVMDLSQVLSQAQSADHATRTQAEAFLSNAERDQTAPFSLALVGELANQTQNVHVRQLAGLQLKNIVAAKLEEYTEEKRQRWLGTVDAESKGHIRNTLLQCLLDSEEVVRHTAAQCIGAIASVDIPAGAWPTLVGGILECVTAAEVPETSKQAALEACGYMCETLEEDALNQDDTNKVLTAIVDGIKMGRPEPTRQAALTALQNSLEFCEKNFESEGERDVIMRIACEATQGEPKTRQLAFECLARIAALYYRHLAAYIETIYGLCMESISSDSEDVGLMAIEFWSTVADVEVEIQEEERDEKLGNYVSAAAKGGLVHRLLETMCKQEEDADADDWNLPNAAAVCLGPIAQTIGDEITELTMPFITSNIQNPDWRLREAATMAFGQILDGPEQNMDQMVGGALQILINALGDPHVLVKDTSAWTISRIAELHPAAIPTPLVHEMFGKLLAALDDEPRVAEKASTAIHHLTDAREDIAEGGPWLTQELFAALMEKLFQVTQREDCRECNLRSTAYETVNMLIEQHPPECRPIVLQCTTVAFQRLQATYSMQIVSRDDKEDQDIMQALQMATLHMIMRSCDDGDVAPFADEAMQHILQVLQMRLDTATPEAFTTAGVIADKIGATFERYCTSFMPFLLQGLENLAEYQVLSSAVGVVGDVARSIEDKILPYCDQIVQALLAALQNAQLRKDVKPNVLAVFGDIAMALGKNFDKYVQATLMVLYQASLADVGGDEDMIDYLNELREGILDAYTGVLNGLFDGGVPHLILQIPVEGQKVAAQGLLEFLEKIGLDDNKDMAVLKCAVGLMGDLANYLPQMKNHLKTPNVFRLVEQAEQTADQDGGDQATAKTAKYAREKISM
uniref:Importin N-terminal domain-containing protein n=1 Tax=Rhizochromulina marina TaxID=1034831 RepID=A0A7S2R3W5_9STRA